MENRAHALMAGLFVLLLGGAAVVLITAFGKPETRVVHYSVATTHAVTGLKAEAPVRYRGVEVGRVDSIKIEPGVAGRIEIRIAVEQGTPITKGTYAQLGYQGVTGLAYVSLNDDGSSAVLLKPQDGEVPQIAMRRSIMDSGEDLLVSVQEAVERVNGALGDENQEAMRRALSGVEAALAKASSAADRAGALADQARALAERATALASAFEPAARATPDLIAEARAAVARADQLMAGVTAMTARLEQRLQVLDRIAANVDEVGVAARSVNDETIPRLNSLVDQLTQETRSLDRVLSVIGENPQSMVFGHPAAKPGPGEPGFQPVKR